MPAPLLQVVADGNALLTTSEDQLGTILTTGSRPSGLGNSVQLLGVGSSATPGILQPGESGRVAVYYVGLSTDNGANQLTFSLGSLTTADTTEKVWYRKEADPISFSRPAGGGGGGTTTVPINLPPHADPPSGAERLVFERPGTGDRDVDVRLRLYPNTATFEEYVMIDWNAVRESRPSSVPADAWDAILVNLRSSYGDFWADYVATMAGNANALALVGQRTSDLSALWGFEVAQASAALSPVRYLAGAVDAAVTAPGLPLVFSRVYGQDLVSRFKTGPLGRGWSHNWDIAATTDVEGNVILHGPGGVDRFFTRADFPRIVTKSPIYLASPGDNGRLTSDNGLFTLRETDGTTWKFRVDGKLDYVQDTNSNRITLGYDTPGRLISLTHSSGRQLLLQYTILDFGMDPSSARIERLIDTMGPGAADDRVTTYQYDSGDLVRVTAPGNRVTTYAYAVASTVPFAPFDGRGRPVAFPAMPDPRSHALTSVTHPDGSHDFFAYDARGRLTETKRDGDTERVAFSYSSTSTGEVTVTDATNRATTLRFGFGGQLVQVRDADGRIVGFGYDSKFQLDGLGGPGGEEYDYTYDARGNLTGITDALNLETTFTYEPTFNRLASFTDARGNGIDYSYDTRGNLTAIAYEDGSRETFTYDTRGNVLTATNRRNQTISYSYNTAGQVLTKDDSTTPGLVDYVYTYDTAGNLTSARDPSGTTTLAYEPLTDRLRRIDYPGGRWFAFTYDAVGRRRSRTDQDGNVVNYTYDAIGRLDRMSDGAGALIVDYDYDTAGRLSRKSLGNGVYTTYAYDDAGHVTSLVNTRADGTVLSRFDYT